MFLEIITPDEKVFEGEVNSAIFPGSDGYFQVLNDHANMVSSLGQGDVQFKYKEGDEDKETHILIEGGIVEVRNNKVMVLAESLVD